MPNANISQPKASKFLSLSEALLPPIVESPDIEEAPDDIKQIQEASDRGMSPGRRESGSKLSLTMGTNQQRRLENGLLVSVSPTLANSPTTAAATASLKPLQQQQNTQYQSSASPAASTTRRSRSGGPFSQNNSSQYLSSTAATASPNSFGPNATPIPPTSPKNLSFQRSSASAVGYSPLPLNQHSSTAAVSPNISQYDQRYHDDKTGNLQEQESSLHQYDSFTQEDDANLSRDSVDEMIRRRRQLGFRPNTAGMAFGSSEAFKSPRRHQQYLHGMMDGLKYSSRNAQRGGSAKTYRRRQTLPGVNDSFPPAAAAGQKLFSHVNGGSLSSTASPSVVPPSLRGSTKMDMDQLASLMKMASSVSPKKRRKRKSASTRSKKPPYSAFGIFTSSKKKKRKAKRATPKKSKTQPTENIPSPPPPPPQQQDEPEEETTPVEEEYVPSAEEEALLDQISDLESRLLQAENEAMLWKARYHSHKNESDELISDLQQSNSTFKSVLDSLQEKQITLSSIQQERNEEIKKLNASIKSNVQSTQKRHKKSMSDLQSEYTTKLEQLEKNLLSTLQKTKQDISDSFEHTHKLKERYSEEFKRLQEERDKELENIRVDIRADSMEVSAVNVVFQRQLEETHNKYQKDVESSYREHEDTVENQKTNASHLHQSLLKEYRDKLTRVKNSYEKQITHLRDTHQKELQSLRSHYSDKIMEQKREHDRLFSDLQEDNESHINKNFNNFESMLDEDEGFEAKEQLDIFTNEYESSSNAVLMAMREQMEENEKKSQEYRSHVKELIQEFKDRKEETLQGLIFKEEMREIADEEARASTAASNSLSQLHDSLLHEFSELRTQPVFYTEISASMQREISKLRQEAARSRRMFDDLKTFANRQKDQLQRKQAEVFMQHMKSQYAVVLRNLRTKIDEAKSRIEESIEKYPSPIATEEQKSQKGSTEDSPHNTVSAPQSTHNRKGKKQLHKPLMDETQDIMDSFNNFQVENPFDANSMDLMTE